MLPRRTLLLTLFAATALPAAGHAADAASASALVDEIGRALVAIVNGPDSVEKKQAALQALIDRSVDVDAVAQFCLGRFWRTATPAQQAAYLQLFHRALLRNITGKLGEYRGVKLTLGRTVPRDPDVGVAMVVERPNNPPADVEWIVRTSGGAPQVIDLVAEGTSLRLTQRNDYASFITHNGGSIDALLNAMRRQDGAS